MEKETINLIRRHGKAQSSEIYRYINEKGEKISLITVKRLLSRMHESGILSVSGSGPSTAYELSEFGKLTTDIDSKTYCAMEPDKRFGARSYNFALLSSINFNPFTPSELQSLDEATKYYQDKSKNITDVVHKKELERFIIELSWKSSKIEGNTYNLLDTEKLILYGKEASGHSQEEARMILNHKEAFTFVYNNTNMFTALTRPNIEQIHKIIVHDMDIKHNIRSGPVGITGSIYRPLDNSHQITEAIDDLSKSVSQMQVGYAKALIALLGISYIQPFEDGNKRTARLTANAILLAHHLAPLSYRSVDENAYREATLVFYELNSLVPFKKIFIEQYIFAAKNYLIDRGVV